MSAVVTLQWESAPNGERHLYAGDQVDPIASGVWQGAVLRYTVRLPGQPFGLKRSEMGQDETEAFIEGVVTAWFQLASAA